MTTQRTEYLTTRTGQGVEGALAGYGGTKLGLAALARLGVAVPGAGWVVAAGTALAFLWGATRGRKVKVSTIKEAGKSRIPVQQGGVPYVVGRASQKGTAVLAKNRSQAWSDDNGNAATLDRVELHLVLLLGRGKHKGYSLKLDGKVYEVDHVRRASGQIVGIVRAKERRRNVVCFPMLEADGRPCESLMHYLPQYWTPAHRLEGWSYVHVYMAQGRFRPFQLNSDWTFDAEPDSGAFMEDFPKVEVISRGRTGIVTPLNPTGEYSENAADICYDYLTNIRKPKVAPEKVNLDSYRESRAYAGQWLKWVPKDGYKDRGIRYAAGGIVYSDDDRAETERQLGFAMSGAILQRGDEWHIRAGKQRPIAYTITDDDVDVRGLPTVRVSSPLEQRANKLTCTMAQSQEQDFAALKVSYEDRERILFDGEFLDQDIREIGFVPSPYQMGRCLHNLLKLSYGRGFSMKLRATMPLLRAVRAGNFVRLNTQTPNPLNLRCIVDETKLRADWSLDVVLVEVLPDAFDDVTIQPPDKTREDDYTITGYKTWGGPGGFQGKATDAFLWRAGFGGYEMIVPATAKAVGQPNVVWDNLDNTGEPQWPFGDFEVGAQWESPSHVFRSTLPDGRATTSGFSALKVDVAYKAPNDAPSGARVLPAEGVMVSVRAQGTDTWYDMPGVVSGRWAELRDFAAPWSDGVRVTVPLGGGENVALTGVTVAVGQPLGGGTSEYDSPTDIGDYSPPQGREQWRLAMPVDFGYSADLAALRAEVPSGSQWFAKFLALWRKAFGTLTKFTDTSSFAVFTDGSLDSDAYAVVVRDGTGKIPKAAIPGLPLKYLRTENLPSVGNGSRVSQVLTGYRLEGDTIVVTWQDRMRTIAGAGSPDECTDGQVWDRNAGQCVDPNDPVP